MAEACGEFAEVEAVIRLINGVTDCRIITGEAGEIEEIHVLAKPHRSPKQIVRDIESACIARFGLRVDHKKISVAQMHGADFTVPRASLLELDGFVLRRGQRYLEVKVQINGEERTFEGSARGRDTQTNRLRLFGEATLAALREYFGAESQLLLEEVRVDTVGRVRVVLVALTLVTPFGEEDLVGMAPVEKDEGEAVVRAVLNASRPLKIRKGDQR